MFATLLHSHHFTLASTHINKTNILKKTPTMNPDHEPLSPPTSPPPEEEEGMYTGEASDSNCGDTYTPVEGSDPKDDYSESSPENDEDSSSSDNHENVPSSPPTSIETMSKDTRTISASISPTEYHAPAVETEDEDDDDETHRREYFQYDTGNDTFSHHRKNWETSSQWEDDDDGSGEPSSHPPLARVQSQSSSSRKSPAPSSPLFPPRPRQTASKSNLSHQFSHHHRRSPASRASSGSYEREHIRDEKKPPLVLLHVTLLLFPGAEEVVLRHLTPTTIERGVLVEHPRGDYNLLEELILDGLGLDEDFVEESEETEEPQEKTWEQALNIVPVAPPKKAWQLRVYASNGLMTPGAWKRVWAEMERIDVEIWPRGFDRNKRGSVRSFGGHSRGSSSAISAVMMEDEGEDGKVYGGRRSGSGEVVQRLASPAPVQTSPVRVRTPTAGVRGRRGRSRTQVGFGGVDLGKFLTPKVVVIGAGVNLLLFLYFTVFRFISVGAWTGSVGVASPFGGETEGVQVQVHEVVDERYPVEMSSEGCGGEVVTEEDVDEQRVLEEEDELDELDAEFVADPEIGEAGEAPVEQLELDDENMLTFNLDYGASMEQLEQYLDHSEVDSEETDPDDVVEGEQEVGAEVQVEEEQMEEEQAEEKTKYSFLNRFGLS